MTGWNPNLSEAPLDCRIWLASECGKVIPTYWDKKRNQWAGFATNGKPPIAWQPYVVPEHPGALTALERLQAKLITTKHTFIDDAGGGQ